MKKIAAIIIFSVLSASYLSSTAQLKQVAASTKFEEPSEGFVRIVQMGNGKSIYVNITRKNGILLRIYDATHSEKVVTSVNPSFERVVEEKELVFVPTKNKDNKEKIENIFDLNGDIVIFFSEKDSRKTVLYRVTIDGNTGKLKDEKNMFDLPPSSDYAVVKDPESDNYAIRCTEYGKTDGQRIIQYGPDQKEINSVIVHSPEEASGYDYFIFEDMVVIGNDKVCAFYNACSLKKFTGKGNLYMVTMEKGSSQPSYSKLNLPADQIYKEAVAKYNPSAKNIVILTIAETKPRSEEYIPYLAIIDPSSKKSEAVAGFAIPSKMNEDYKERFNKSKDYTGLPQDIYINTDGSFSIVYEENLIQYQQSGNYTRTDSKLGKMIITTHDKNGKLISDYLVPKSHWLIFTEMRLLYHARAYTQKINKGNQYKSFYYLPSTNGNYILFIDSERNNEIKKDKITDIEGVAECDEFMYKLTGNEMIPKREYAFGQKEKGHTMAMSMVSDYDKKTNTLVTLQLDKQSARDNMVNIVWLQP